MQIKTQLGLLLGLAIVTVGMITVSMAITNTAMSKGIAYSQQAYDITYDVSILHRLASELTQNNYIRIETQWDIVMKRLRIRLNSQMERDIGFTERLKMEEERTNLAFEASIRTFREGDLNNFNGDYRNAQFLSRNYLAVVLTNLVALANDMTQESYLYINKTRTRHNVILAAYALANLLFISCWLAGFWRAIMTPLRRTLQAIQLISEGDFQYRIPSAQHKGEMHILVNMFNRMMDRLQELTVSSEHLLKATEDERSRIGRELHDGISQTLVGARFKLESMATCNAAQEKQRQKIIYYMTLAQQDIQRIVKDLQPVMLHESKLVDALHCFAKQNSNGHKITLDFGLEEQDIPLSLHIPIFRIVQEATNNAQRHGNALHVNIQMNKENNAINLFIEDDGHGFDPAEMEQGNGLINIRERVAAENGELTIDSAPGRGCCIIVSFPLKSGLGSG